jgi:hypothetical protein
MRVYVYKDGALINPDTPTDDSKNYSIKYEWEGNCVSLSATDKPQI